MKDILMDYMQTGYAGEYRPRDVVAAIEDGELHPVFSGADACTTERGIEIRRQMYVEGRRFIISSVLSPAGGDTPTKRLLQVIDNDLKKNGT